MMSEQEVIRQSVFADTLWATRYFFFRQMRSKFVVGDPHLRIAEALDRVFKGECTRLIINMPPRYGKTQMIKSFVMKGLAMNPASRYILLSYSSNLSLDNSEKIKDAVASDWYQWSFPYVQIKKDAKGKQKWETTAGGGVYATSSNGQVTGFGAGRMATEVIDDENFPVVSDEAGYQWGGAIIIDDPLKPLDAQSPTMREKVNNQFDDTIRSRVNDRRTPIIIIMQRLHKEDLCGHLIDSEGEDWEVLSMPAIQRDEDGNESALWPFKHTLEELHALRRKNPYTFDTQYNQDPHAINEKRWLFAFDRMRNTGHVEFDPAYPLYMTFDFNRSPMTSTLFQIIGGAAYGVDCIRLENATTRMVCQEIDRRYGAYDPFYIVTGDCAGSNLTTMSLVNNYDEIKNYFRLTRNQMQYGKSNPKLSESRLFMNSLFERYHIVYDSERCKPAIWDFENVMSDDTNHPIKTNRENAAQQADFLDNNRYFFHRFYRELDEVIE